MAKIIQMPKPDTQEAQIQEYINRLASLQSKDDFDPKLHTWSRVIFYIILIGMVAGMLAWQEAHACFGIEEAEPVVIKVVNL